MMKGHSCERVWDPNSIPELQGLSKLKQWKLWREAHHAALRISLFWVAHIVPWVGAAALTLVFLLVVDAFRRNTFIAVGWMFCWMFLGLWICNHIVLRVMRPLLAQRPAALGAHPPAEDGSYYVPPAF